MPRYTFTLITLAGLGALTHALYVRHSGAPVPAVPVWMIAASRTAMRLGGTALPVSAPGPPPKTRGASATPPPVAVADEPPARENPTARNNLFAPAIAELPGAPQPAAIEGDRGWTATSPTLAEALTSPLAAASPGVAAGNSKAAANAAEKPCHECGGRGSSALFARPPALALRPAKPPVRSVADNPAGAPAGDGTTRAVRFAGGVVEAYVPPTWQVGELPCGRRTRLLITPPRRLENTRDVVEGVWITYHPRAAEPGDSFQCSTQLCEQALRRVAGEQITLTPYPPLVVDTWPTVRVDFYLPAAGLPPNGLRGFRALVQTAGGMCEVHAMTSVADYAQVAPFFERILMSLRFSSSPEPEGDRAAAQPSGGPDLAGVWQGTDQRVRIGGDGQITFDTDPPWQTTAAVSGFADPRNRSPRNGRYEVRNDLLMVWWKDGTRTNYRWQFWNGRLLLTDESGRVATLDRSS